MGQAREHEPPLPEPLAYFLTWSTYRTWLPGDERGWIEYRHDWQVPDPVRKLEAEARMTEGACRFDGQQRAVVERQVAETCRIRGWHLHAVNCRSNHVHVIVTADRDPAIVRNQLKAWCTRRLKDHDAVRQAEHGRTRPVRCPRDNWWAERGSQCFINDSASLDAAIIYVRERQDRLRQNEPEA